MSVQLLPACAGPSQGDAKKSLKTNPLYTGSPLAVAWPVQVSAQISRRAPRLPSANITGQGLASMAILVSLLWSCVIGQRVILRRANACAGEAIRAMHEMQMKNRRVPAAVPAPRLHPESRVLAG